MCLSLRLCRTLTNPSHTHTHTHPSGGALRLLVLGASNDKVVPAAMVTEVANTWAPSPPRKDIDNGEVSGVQREAALFVPQQGHQLGDTGWQDEVFPRLVQFLATM